MRAVPRRVHAKMASRRAGFSPRLVGRLHVNDQSRLGQTSNSSAGRGGGSLSFCCQTLQRRHPGEAGSWRGLVDLFGCCVLFFSSLVLSWWWHLADDLGCFCLLLWLISRSLDGKMRPS